MKFLLTMNMPAASGISVHQMTLEHPAKSLEELCEIINSEEFMIFHQWYRRKTIEGEMYWQDRGNIIVNTHHIGKVQEYFDPTQEEFGRDDFAKQTHTPKFRKVNT